MHFLYIQQHQAHRILKYHFETINSIEKILEDLDTMEDDIKALYRECGNFECGGDLI